MSKIVKVNLSETDLFTKSLVKELGENEELCPHCGGTGLIIINNALNPQSIVFCPHCTDGVVRRCKFCGNVIPKHHHICHCPEQLKLDDEERKRREAERLANAPLAPENIEKSCEMFFSEDYPYNDGFFPEWEWFFTAWFGEHKTGDKRPEYVWTTKSANMEIDACNIVENASEPLYEEAYFDVSDDKIQKLQSYLDDWCKTCGIGTTYYPNEYKVRIPWEDFEEE